LGLNNGGTITAGGRLFVSSGGQVRSAFDIPSDGAIGTIAAQTLEIAGTQGIDLVTNTTGSGDVFMNSAAGQVRVTDIDANRDVTLNGVAGTSFTRVRGDRNVGVFSDVAINGGSASAGGRLTVTSDGGITVGALDAGTVDPAAGVTPDIYVRALGPITTGAVTSAGDVGLLAQGALATGGITSGRDLVLLSGGTITTAALTTPTTGRLRLDDFAQRSLITFPNGVPDYSALLVSAPTARAGDTIVTGSVTTGLFEARSIGLLRVTGAINAAIGARLSVRSLEIGSTSTPGFLDLTAVDSLVLADIAAQGQINLASDGSITAGNITTAQSLVLAANRPGATLTTGNVRADGEIRLSSNTTLTAGSLSSGNRVFLNAGGAITTGAIDAGRINSQSEASGVLFATSPATIRTGTINVSGSATLSGVLGVTTGNVTASSGIVLLDTGGVTTGALSTSTSGFVYIAAHDLLPQITFDQAGNPQFAALLATTPERLVGDINIGGPASTGTFIAAATGSFVGGNTTASTSMLVAVGGTATLGSSINTPSLLVTSSNIVLDPQGSVGAAGGSILFQISQATSAVIGGAGTTATGTYSLSNAEFGALRASSIRVVSFANGGMTVEQLALPAIAPGQIANPGVTLQTRGTMRVTGAVTMAQAGADNRLTLSAADRIEVVQGSGSVRLGAGVDTPAGTLSITAPRIWVASESLLTELAGTTLIGQARIDAVNAAGASVVAGGSIGAGSILIGADREVLIQNSGTDRLKAGFT
ncbi:hypothetical protein, partial [Sandarakinorhabdus sp.]|uniref:beta strand repeat-containing protein n=1 Tax=Sandarakinorhabdus sp. TaxID=1916663 RepID=UPI00286E427C